MYRLQCFSMLVFFILVLINDSNNHTDNEHNPKIFGGSTASNKQFPYVVYINAYSDRKKINCGGSIITNKHVLTAAHCTYNRNKGSFRIYAGVINLRYRFTVEPYKDVNIVIHPNYIRKLHQNDIAIITVDRDFQFSSNVKRVPLYPYDDLIEGSSLIICGWGRWHIKIPKSPNVLQWTNTELVDLKKCKKIYKHTRKITQWNICVKHPRNTGIGSRKGDSGGPIIYQNFYQVAIISWSNHNRLMYPSVTTKVSFYIDWIKQHTNNYTYII